MGTDERKSEPLPEREAVVTRVFDAPARLLFLSYSKCEHIKRWFGPVGYPVTLCEMDFRVGGRFRFAMTGPDGKLNTPFGGTYHEIIPNKKIVFDNGFEGSSERMIMTVTFDEKDGRTTMTTHFEFATIAMRKSHVEAGIEEGTNSALDQLSELAAEMKKKGA
jgi:uncharacterized protein YndB with AHSA1/START domain